MSHQDIPFVVEHLIFEKFCSKHSVVIHGNLSFPHYNRAFLIALDVLFESLLLKLLDHCDVGVFKVANAQIQQLKLLSQLFQYTFLAFAKKRVHLRFMKLVLI